MGEITDFTTILRAFMARARRRPADLEHPAGISARTIENWCGDVVKRPCEITDVLKIARALALDAADATTLLTAADHLPLATLWAQVQWADDAALLNLLAP